MSVFSKLKVELIESRILAQLSWNDLLRLRRVSKELKDLVHGFVNKKDEDTYIDRAPEISVGFLQTHAYPDSKAFLEMQIPTTRLYLRNASADTVKMETPRVQLEIVLFLFKYAHLVKHLRLERFSLYTYPNRELGWDFLDKMTNLESLVVEDFTIGHPFAENPGPSLPASFLNLKSLTLNVKKDHETPQNRGALRSPTIWLIFCGSLEHFSLSVESEEFWNFRTPAGWIDALGAAIDCRQVDQPSWKSVELRVDCMSPEDEEYGNLYRLLAKCARKEIAVRSFLSKWLTEEFLNMLPRARALPATELICDSGDMFQIGRHINLTNVKAFDITDPISVENYKLITGPAALDKLVLHLNQSPGNWGKGVFGSDRIEKADYVIPSLPALFAFLCDRAPAGTLTEVEIRLEEMQNKYIRLSTIDTLRVRERQVKDSLAGKALEMLGKYTPTLRKLTLVNWDGPPEMLAQLWPKVPHLEELKMINAQGLENTVLVKDDTEIPVILKLTNLRKLSLEKLCVFTGSVFFFTVLSQISLTHFSITVDESYPEERLSILYGQLTALRGGPFADSIQEIRWNGCPLHKVESDEKLRELGMFFRSSQML